MSHWPKISKVNPDKAIDDALRTYDEGSSVIVVCAITLVSMGLVWGGFLLYEVFTRGVY